MMKQSKTHYQNCQSTVDRLIYLGPNHLSCHHWQDLERQGKIPIGSRKKLAAEARAKIRADTNAARGISNAARGFGLDIDQFCEIPGPPTDRRLDDLQKKKMCMLLGDEESHQ